MNRWMWTGVVCEKLELGHAFQGHAIQGHVAYVVVVGGIVTVPVPALCIGLLLTGGVQKYRLVNVAGQADGQVAIDGDDDDHPDGDEVHQGRAGLDVWRHGGQLTADGQRQPCDVVAGEELELISEEASEQVEGVDDGQGLQQPVGGVLPGAGVLQNYQSQQVAHCSGDAHGPQEMSVDEHPSITLPH